MFETNWYAAYTKPRHEQLVTSGLEQRGYDVLFPRYRASHRWSDRVKKIEVPLFPGYVFVRGDSMDRPPILQTPGILYLVSDSHGPLPVPESEVETLRRAMVSGAPLHPTSYLSTGDRVRIVRGPLRGLEGILVACRNTLRVVVSVELLARSVAVEIESGWLEKDRHAVAS